MSLEPGRYRFNGTALVPLEIDSNLAFFVADSWLTVDGATVALDRHLARFAQSADAQGLVRPLDEFFTAVVVAIPSTGAWFPRVELTVRGELQLSLRKAPERTLDVIAWSSPTDPRTEPALKGPDIPALEELRVQARATGATEPVILNSEGFIVDGATTCLMWWREGILYTPPAEYARVDSVTVSVVRDLAAAAGVSVREELAGASDLAGAEVWALNALHGIRPVRSWIGGPELTVDPERLGTWRQWYESARQA
jgi:branched-subunit amino acid aminotransferase/4-amino-4-deoxychorismate lyase